ncbi:MAG: amino acid permease [Cyclobacteriaceae bacterium]
MTSAQSKKIGLSRATSLVVGNMIGAGIFLLPASLATLGSISFIGWMISGLGTIVLAVVFSRLSRIITKSGGPYAYAQAAYGDFVGFITAWSYWVSILATNAGIAIAFSGYLGVFLPFANGKLGTAIISISAVGLLTIVNLRGTAAGAGVQLITTILKVIPLIFVCLVGTFFIEPSYLVEFNVSEQSHSSAIAAAITLTLFALTGFESATLPSGDIEDSDKTVPRATIIGTIAVVVIYMISSAVIMGLIPNPILQTSTAPFADAAEIIMGSAGKYLVAFGALISTFGALNGWILLQGHITMSPAEDGLFPKFFAKKNANNISLFGHLLSSLLVTFFITANSAKGLVALFTFLILVSTFCLLIPYLFVALSEILIIIKSGSNRKTNLEKAAIFGIIGFLYTMWAVIGSPNDVVFYGVIFLLMGIPVYVWAKYVNRSG